MSDKKESRLLTDEAEAMIRRFLTRGSTVELKKENGQLTVVEIERRKRLQLPLNR